MMTISRRAVIASALEHAGEAGVSGEVLAADLGITRVAVNRHIAVLRELGYAIHSTPHVGYRLESAPDICIPEEVAPRLQDPLWVSCEGGMESASTNDEAKRLARAGRAEGTVVVAARQTQGRGRFGRVWESPSGGAYVSCILRPPLAPSAVAPLSLAIALGAARGLESLGVPVGLKWPNDVEVSGRKLAGILLEMAAEADRVEWVVAGCGVNVGECAHERSATVREAVPSAQTAEVAAALLDGIAVAYREFVESGFAGMRAEYEARSTLSGRAVTVRDVTGASVAEGTVVGTGDDGALLLATKRGEVRLSSGEVTLGH
ncbi:MAG: biotin--[acetyl-CoA-carboxylase] ligase [Coriobacteriia bacterium]|nr:biotin--[acetyl-CoA-carboxylase] ligase [Coriobacteriia bacterium]